MTLHLTATTIEEKALKEYLEQTVSEVLADKINNGVPVEKDGKKLLSRTRRKFARVAQDACIRSTITCGKEATSQDSPTAAERNSMCTQRHEKNVKRSLPR